jgi:hypothetical protein
MSLAAQEARPVRAADDIEDKNSKCVGETIASPFILLYIHVCAPQWCMAREGNEKTREKAEIAHRMED